MEIAKGEVASSAKRVDKAEEKAKCDVEMAVRQYMKTKAFQREADANYLAGLKECRAMIMKAHPKLDFSFIASATKTQPDPNFQAEGEGEVAPLVPLDDEYEASIDTKESKKRHRIEEGEEVEQSAVAEVGEASHGGEVTRIDDAGEVGAA